MKPCSSEHNFEVLAERTSHKGLRKITVWKLRDNLALGIEKLKPFWVFWGADFGFLFLV